MSIPINSIDYNGFDPNTMQPGEVIAFSDNDPSSPDGKSLNVAFDKGNVKRLLTYDDMAGMGIFGQHFCAPGEFGETTMKPTISNPSTTCIYYVPTDSDGAWDKYIYQGDEWLKIGSTNDLALITTGRLENGCVTSPKVGPKAITTAKIDDKAVGTDQIADNAVGSTQIADNAIESSHIAENAVGQTQIAANSVGSNELTQEVRDSISRTKGLSVIQWPNGSGAQLDIPLSDGRVLHFSLSANGGTGSGYSITVD